MNSNVDHINDILRYFGLEEYICIVPRMKNQHSLEMIKSIYKENLDISKSIVRLVFVQSMVENDYWSGNPDSKINKIISGINNQNKVNIISDIKKYLNRTKPCKNPSFESSNYNSNQYNVYLAAKVKADTSAFLDEKRRSLKDLLIDGYHVHHIIPKNLIKKSNVSRKIPIADCIPLDESINSDIIKDCDPRCYLNRECLNCKYSKYYKNPKEWKPIEWQKNLEQNDIPCCVIKNPKCLKPNKYSDFLEYRRKLMIKFIEDYVDSIK